MLFRGRGSRRYIPSPSGWAAQRPAESLSYPPVITLLDVLLYLLIAAVAGGIGRAIAGGTRGGCVVSIVLGFIGAVLGSWLARKMKLPELLYIRLGDGPGFPFLWAVIGAALFVAVVVALSGGRRE